MKAAFAFLRLGNAEGLGDWMGTVRLFYAYLPLV